MNQVECLLTGYSPLGSPDKPFKEENEPEPLLKDDTIGDIAKRNNKSATQILFKWQVKVSNICRYQK